MDENTVQQIIWNYEQLRNIVRPESIDGITNMRHLFIQAK